MIVISPSLALTTSVAEFNGDSPIIGYTNYATTATATTEEEGYEAEHLLTPDTYTRWRATDDTEVVTFDVVAPDEIDYVGIAGHNFGTAQIEFEVEAFDGSWNSVVSGTLTPDDSPILARFSPGTYTQVRINMAAGTEFPEMAVVYVGKLLIMQRRIAVGHTPIKYGRRTRISNGRSETGQFLGRIVLSEAVQTEANFNNLTGAWYRANFDPFVIAAQEVPFFWGWRPLTYPNECGYAWLTEDPVPQQARPGGFINVSLAMSGIAK